MGGVHTFPPMVWVKVNGISQLFEFAYNDVTVQHFKPVHHEEKSNSRVYTILKRY